MVKLSNLSSISAGIQGENSSVAFLSINRGYLWRHWHESSLRLLVDIQFATLASGPRWGAIVNYLEPLHDGNCKIRVCHSSC